MSDSVPLQSCKANQWGVAGGIQDRALDPTHILARVPPTLISLCVLCMDLSMPRPRSALFHGPVCLVDQRGRVVHIRMFVFIPFSQTQLSSAVDIESSGL